MHVLAVNSVSTLLNYLTEQLQNTPTIAQIQAFANEAQQAADKLVEEKDEVSRMFRFCVFYIHVAWYCEGFNDG